MVFINIVYQGTIYFSPYGPSDDDTFLHAVSKKLQGVTRESIFDAVYLGLGKDWRQQDDIVRPFEDPRHVLVSTVWIFDLDNDILRRDKKNGNSQISLALIRQGTISLSEFQPCDSPVNLDRMIFTRLTWSPWSFRRSLMDRCSFERYKAFSSRMLSDLACQWRHILLSQYNDATFKKLAYAVLKIATLDFTVLEVTGPRHTSGGYFVGIQDLPKWSALQGNISRHASASIVVSRHMPHAVELIRENFADRCKASTSENPRTFGNSRFYLILTMGKVVQYFISDDYEGYSTPKDLLVFKNEHIAPGEGLEILLEYVFTRPRPSLLNKLPPELQNMILDNVSSGPIERNRIGCVLDIGSMFQWKSGGRAIERQDVRTHLMSTPRTESHITLDGEHCGLVYK